jgi:hypothetical protein
VDPNNATLCVIALNSAATGTCNATFAAPISETITAKYSGDTNYLASSGAAMLVSADLPVKVTLTASQLSEPFGTAVNLTWTSNNAGSCTESGGAAGDLWGSGTASLNGSQSVTESAAGAYTYTMTCLSPDGTVQNQASVTVQIVPTLTLSASQNSVAIGTAVNLSWTSTGAGSCTESGGSSGDGWTGLAPSLNGTQAVTETIVGTYAYMMSW